MAEESGKPQLARRAVIGDIATQPRLNMFKNDDVARSVVDKLIQAPLSRFTRRQAQTGIAGPELNYVQGISEKTASNISDNRNMLQLLPDLELGVQIMISGILAPNDLLSSELTITSNAKLLESVEGKLLDVIISYFKDSYDIESQLEPWLKDILFNTGSNILAVLPESTIDDLIQSSTRMGSASVESLQKIMDENGSYRSLGLLGPSGKEAARGRFNAKVAIESLNRTTTQPAFSNVVGNEAFKLTVTDNPSVLKNPALLQRISNEAVLNRLDIRSLSLEADKSDKKQKHVTDERVYNTFFKPKNFQLNTSVSLKTQVMLDKDTVGHPTVMRLPSESVIPVHVPGDPDNHLGYYVLVDVTGNPVNKALMSDYYRDITTNMQNNRDMTSQLLTRVKMQTQGYRPNDGTVIDINMASFIYTQIVEEDLIARLKNGIYGDNVAIGRPHEVYRIMMARALAGMYTQLIYIPAQLVTYMALDYNQYGIGKSLLEDTKIIGALRAVTMFANTLNGIKNSINHTEIAIELDPEDPDPDHTIEMIRHEYVKARSNMLPIYTANPVDIVNSLQNSGVEMNVTGHPGWPGTKVTISEKATNRILPSTDIDDLLKKRQLMGMGLSPETVELSLGADFATSVIQNNLMFAKQANIKGKKFCVGVGDFMVKFTLNSQILMDTMRGILKEETELLTKIDPNKKFGIDGVIMYFLNTLSVSLPEPNIKGIALQMEGFEEYNKALDAVLPSIISRDMFNEESMGALANSIDGTVAIVKGYFQRRWLRANNVLPEVFEILEVNENQDLAFNLLNIHEEHVKSLSKSILAFMANSNKRKEIIERAVNAVGGPAEAGASSSSEPSSDTGDEGAGGGDFGNFDFGADEGGGEETPPEGGEAETGAEPPA